MLTCLGTTGLHVLSSSEFLPFAWLAVLIREERDAVRYCPVPLCFPRLWLMVHNGSISAHHSWQLEKRMVGRGRSWSHTNVCAQTQEQQTIRSDLWGSSQRSFVALPFSIRTQHVKQKVFNFHSHSWVSAIQGLIKAPLFPDQWKYATCI